jgi:hypothetical protein
LIDCRVGGGQNQRPVGHGVPRWDGRMGLQYRGGLFAARRSLKAQASRSPADP